MASRPKAVNFTMRWHWLQNLQQTIVFKYAQQQWMQLIIDFFHDQSKISEVVHQLHIWGPSQLVPPRHPMPKVQVQSTVSSLTKVVTRLLSKSNRLLHSVMKRDVLRNLIDRYCSKYCNTAISQVNSALEIPRSSGRLERGHQLPRGAEGSPKVTSPPTGRKLILFT